MTALTSPRSARREGVAHDALLLAWRNYKHHVRVPSLIVFSAITPLIFLLLFRYVLGGSVVIPGVSYVDYLVPGVVVQAIAFGATQTGVGLALDVGRGITDRFRSLPIARSAVLTGRALTDTGRNLVVAAVVVVAGLVIGFRPDANPAAVVAAIGIALAFGFAFSWVAAFIGVTVRHAESVHDAGFVWVVPLTFASSALVSVDTMPAGVRWLAEGNPMTSVADATRALMLGNPAGGAVARSVAWIAALLVVFVPLAVRAYQRR
ncbi:MAG TPA: ABC transporter permease [Acidimicrobiales bacterium]|nr:ABC transporter permease [Acidimicrobiales bacterium]